MMDRRFLRRNRSLRVKNLPLISMFVLLFLPFLCEAIEIAVDPHVTSLEISGDSPAEIFLSVRTLPSRSYQWRLEGPGRLMGDTENPAVIYKAPSALNEPETVATIWVTIVDGEGKKTTDSFCIRLRKDLPLEPEEVATPLKPTIDLLEKAEAAIKNKRFTTPESVSAFFYYQQVFEKDPDNIRAKEGIERILAAYERRIRHASNPSRASSFFKRYKKVADYYSKVTAETRWQEKVPKLSRFTKPPEATGDGSGRTAKEGRPSSSPSPSPFDSALKMGEEAMAEGRLRSAASHLFNAMALGNPAAVISKLKELKQACVTQALNDLKAERYGSATLKYRYARMIEDSLSASVDGDAFPENPIEEWHQRVKAAISDGDRCYRKPDCDLKSALARYQDALRLDPINVEARKRLKMIAYAHYQSDAQTTPFSEILNMTIYDPLKNHITQYQSAEEPSLRLLSLMKLVVLYKMSIEWLREYGDSSKEYIPILEEFEKQYKDYKKVFKRLSKR